MKVLSGALTLLSILPSISLAAEPCVKGDFEIHISKCTPKSVVEAYEKQVISLGGGVCAMSAEDDLLLKIKESGGNTLEDLCDVVYRDSKKIPFKEAANRYTGDDDSLHFERMFFNGKTDWQEEIETKFENIDETPTSVLKEDAERIKTFYHTQSRHTPMEWPGELPNFQSSVKDSNGLATSCTTNAAMCCWPKDRQANDNNGNCATPYDTNCVDKDPADNTNLCYVDLGKGNQSTNFDSEDIMVHPGDDGQGEGNIHCHGFAWSNDVKHESARWKANNLFFVSMYDHMYSRGYVKNIPGAPMCGCVEQMPTVTRSDCTQINIEEEGTRTIFYDAANAKFTVEEDKNVRIKFNSCRGKNNKNNNDLWSYMAKLFEEGHVTREQFGELGRTITNTNCYQATEFALSKKGLTPGYDHDVSRWTYVAGRDNFKLSDHYGDMAFRHALGFENNARDHYGIIYRVCQTCIRTHKKIFYRRKTPVPDTLNLLNIILFSHYNGNGKHNTWNTDFTLHSTFEDAINNENPWKCEKNLFKNEINFYGGCSPDGTKLLFQRSHFRRYEDKHEVAFYVAKPEEQGFEVVPSTAIKSRYYLAGGVTLKDTVTGDIYMTGSGTDISSSSDDFHYYSQAASGDHTAIVHVSRMNMLDHKHWAKSGIMFRQSMDPKSPFFMIIQNGGKQVCTQGRSETGEPVWSYNCHSNKYPWLKIEKRMDTYTSYTGTEDPNGGDIIWKQSYSTNMPKIGDSYNIGLATSSNNWREQETIYKNYEVDQYFFPSAAPTTSSPPTIDAPPSSDIGNPLNKGSALKLGPGHMIVKGSGRDIWGPSDQFHFLHIKMTGDVTVEMKVLGFDYTVHDWQKGGIMIRDRLTAGSKHFSLFYTGSNGSANQWRTKAWQNSGHNSPNPKSKDLPVWFQVKKVGNEYTASRKFSESGDWMSTEPRKIDFDDEPFYVGIAVTSHVTAKIAFEVEDFTINGKLG